MSTSGPNGANLSLLEIYHRQVEATERENSQHWQQALIKWRVALRENPRAPETYIEIMRCYRKLKDHAAAITILEEGLNRCDPEPSLHLSYINFLAQCNRTREAIDAAHRASLLFPDEVLMKLKESCLLPILYESTGEVNYYRGRFSEGLAKLSEGLCLDDSAEKRKALSAIASHSNVHLGYQGQNDRELQVRYGEMVHRIMAANYPQWTVPVQMPQETSNGTLRVGYISSRFRNLSATKYFLGWLREHNKERFTIYSYHAGTKTDTTTEEVRRASGQFRQLSDSLEETCRAILADRLHVLVFWDVGISATMSQLAALRLAPIQCAAWDQPITTGSPTMDYFLSSELAEPEDGQNHYSERLIRLPGIGACYQKPVIPVALFDKTRRDFQIREDAIVYLCIQYAFKYLPDQDDCFVQIAKRVPNSQFVFLTPNSFVAADFQKRLDRAFSLANLRAGDYCILLPEVERFNYWNLCVLGDVVLDTMSWSGGVSTFEAIACRQPVVTLPGPFMRGRQSYAILKQLGVTETIVKDKDDYVAIAARLGLDRSWRDAIVDKMIANYSLLYSDRRCVEALEEFYERVVEERLAEKSTGSPI